MSVSWVLIRIPLLRQMQDTTNEKPHRRQSIMKFTSYVDPGEELILGRRKSSFLKNPSVYNYDADNFLSLFRNTFIKRSWWKEAVVYQIYWRSFYDSDGDGIGDLRGVIDKLDYIRSLGVGIVWINPFYESPDFDNGYDISNYKEITKKAGDLAIFDELLCEIHSRGMKLIMDIVVNHTSHIHPWFVESRSSRDNPKRNWYIWRDPKPNGDPPNNWRSYFCPSTWEYDEKTKQYYYHSFGIEQPDLNWACPEVRQNIYDIMRWWLDRGIDGFRMDAIVLLAKREQMTDSDNPVDISYLGNNPGIHDYLQEMYEQVIRHYSVFTVGEMPFISPEDGLLYVGEERKELNTLFHFQVCDVMDSMDLVEYKQIQNEWYMALWGFGWNSQFLNNHDHTRQVSRFGNDTRYRVESAKLLATMLHTLPGMPYIYQGEEIGMTGVNYTRIEDYNDLMMINKYKEMVDHGADPASALKQLRPLSRDNSRSPMQWNTSKNAGFTNGSSWIKVNPNYEDINVEEAVRDKNSVFWYYRSLISLRKRHPVMVYGDYKDYDINHPNVYIYHRTLPDEYWLIVLHHGEKTIKYQLPDELRTHCKEIILGNYADSDKDNLSPVLNLRPYEARIYSIALTEYSVPETPISIQVRDSADIV